MKKKDRFQGVFDMLKEMKKKVRNEGEEMHIYVYIHIFIHA